MSIEEKQWRTRAQYMNAVGTIYAVSLGFFVVLSMMFVTLAKQLEEPRKLQAAVCSLPTTVSTTIELTPDSSDNIIDCSGQDITITATGKLIIKSFKTADTSTSNDGGVVLKLGSLTIDAGGELNADGQGYSTDALDGGSATASVGIAAGSGGGHGGAGGSGNTVGGVGNTVGATGGSIGNKDAPVTLGGAGATSGGGGIGGNGGGAIKVVATGTVTINGLITANGVAGTKSADNQTAGGGGAGGSIWVEAGTLAGSGQVQAKGGGSDNTTSYFGGGGGGGRVALICTTTTTFPAGNVSVAAGIGSQNGQVGTLVGPGCKPANPSVLRLFEKNATAGRVDRELYVGELTTKTALTFGSDLAGSNLKLEVEIREANQSFQNTPTNAQVAAASNLACVGMPGDNIRQYGVPGGGSPGTSAPANSGGGGGAGQNGGSNSNGGSGGSGIVIVRYLTANAPTTATGGTITFAGDYTIHTFTSSGTFTISDSISAEYLVVAGGGGGGGGWQGGGGGAGGVLTGTKSLTAGTYPVTVGAGGAGHTGTTPAAAGGNSIFDTLTAIGGGRGGGENPAYAASIGGSGGGGVHAGGLTGAAGTAGQGYAGGNGFTGNPYEGGGGGGAGGAGSSANSTYAGFGGRGIASSISGSTQYYAAGGGGSRRDSSAWPLNVFCGYVEVTTGFLTSKEYKWQARIVSSAGIYSDWVQFGDNSVSATDFTIVGAANSIIAVAGNNQSVTVGQQTPVQPKARVIDAAGYGVPFYALTSWSVTTGAGSLANSQLTADKWGEVTTNWTIGTVAGVNNNSITVTKNSPAMSRVFTASAVPGAIDHYKVNVPSTSTVVNSAFNYTITAQDEYNNTVPFTNNLTMVPVSASDVSTPGLGTLAPSSLSFGTPSGTAPWLNENWGYRKKIQFDNTTANLGTTATSLNNYPVLITLDSSNFDFSKAKTNGEDIRFTDSDGFVELAYEFDHWDSAAQKAAIWVKVPTVNATNTDSIYLYYGNAAASDNQRKTLVWNGAPYAMVQHFSETSGATTNDSTVNGYNGTATGTTIVDGSLGKARSFNGGTDVVNIPNNLGITTGNITVEARFKATAAAMTDHRALVSLYDPTRKADFRIFQHNAGIAIARHKPNVSWDETAQTAITAGQWYNVALVYSGNTLSYYLNGVFQRSVSVSGQGSGTYPIMTAIGNAAFPNSSAGFSGVIDDVKVSRDAKSAAWLAANHKSIAGSFTSFGTEETTGETSGTIYADPDSGVVSLAGSYSYSESIKIKVYDGNGKVGYSNAILVVETVGTCPSVNIDVNQTWEALDVPGGIFDCRGYGLFSVRSGATLTLRSYDNGDANYANDYGATVLADAFNIEQNGVISGNETGYYTGPNAGNSSYGGRNGSGQGTPYGDIYEPTDLGSAGAANWWWANENPGTGGGAVKLFTSGKTTVNGKITSNGMIGGRGGSGGSIWIDTNELAGSGIIEANGGNSGNQVGASGGRIALYYSTNLGFPLIPSNLHAFGSNNQYNEAVWGAAGTVYYENKGVDPVHGGTLMVDNNNHNTQYAGVVSGNYLLKEIKVSKYGHVEFLGNDSVLTLTNPAGFVGDNTKPFIKVSGTLQYTGTGTLLIDGVDLALNGKANGLEDIQIGGTFAAGMTIYGKTWFHNPSNPYSFRDILVKGNGLFTFVSVDTGDTNWTDDYGPYLNARNLTIETGGLVTATGKGYSPYRGPYTQENTPVAYGGYSSTGAKAPYGNLYQPLDLGTAGSGSGFYGSGGYGGGAMKVTLTGTLTNNGTIASNGTNGSWGGTGGSIWIDTNVLAGSGIITADAGNNASAGRIALYFMDNTNYSIVPAKVHAYGNGGGPGTIYFENKSTDASQSGVLMVDNNNVNGQYAGVVSGTYSLKEVRVTKYGHVEFMGSGSILTLNSSNGFTGDNTKPVIKVSGTLRYTGTGTLVMDGVDLGLNGKAEGLQDIRVGGTNAAGLTLYGVTWFHNPSNPYTFNDILIKNNGTLTLVSKDTGDTNWADDFGPTLSAHDLTVEAGGKVTADGKGYTPYRGPYTRENTPVAYGGYPSSGSQTPYGSLYEPTHMGTSGSGSGFYGSGGNGGGAFKLLLSGTLSNDGTISSNGTNGSWGGTGGSIWIDTATIVGAGTITADSGNNASAGRIALYYGTNNGFTLAPSKIHAFGNGGGPGTIYLENKGVDTAFGGTLLVDNNNVNGPAAAVLTGNYTLKEIRVTRYGHVEFLGNTSILNVNSPSGFAGDATKPVVKISGTLKYTGNGVLTMDGVDLGLNGKAEGIDDFQIGGVNAAGLTLYGKTWFHNPSNPYTFRDILVKANGILSLVSTDTGDSNWTDDYGPYLNAHDIVIEAGGTVTSTGRGYTPYRGPYTAENRSVAYGGFVGTDRQPYGNLFEPTDIGTSGSGSGFYGCGGNGGGAMKLTLTGSLVNNGSVQANGTGCSSWPGTGGSIWIDTAVLTGVGTITADGGGTLYSPASSGGRIALYYGTNNGFTLTSANIHAYGGGGSGNGQWGGPGTVYIENKGVDPVHGGILIIDNNNHNTYAAAIPKGSYAFKNIALTKYGHADFLESDSDVTVAGSSGLTGDSTKPTMKVNGTFNYTGDSALTISGLTVALLGKSTGLSDMELGGIHAGALSIYAHTWFYNKLQPHIFGNLTIKGNGTLTAYSYDNGNTNWSDDYGANISVDNLTIENGGVLTATAGGYASGRGPATGGAGATHGGFSAGEQGSTYGNLYEPLSMGSGGSGGVGGGALKLYVVNTLTNNGTLSSNGSTGGLAGSGGSLWIDANSITGAGLITADGGRSDGGNAGAGGGRVALYYDNNDGFATTTAQIHAYGGRNVNNSGYYGGPGTVYIENRAVHQPQVGNLILDNAGVAGRSHNFAAGTYKFNDVSIGQNVTTWVLSDPTAKSNPVSTVAPHSYNPDSSTIAAYNFDEALTTDYEDATANNRRASGGQNITFTTGKFGNAQRVSSGGYGLTFEPIVLTSDYSIDMWVKFPLPTTPEGWRTLAHQNGASRHNIIISSGGQLGAYSDGFYDTGYNVNSLTGWHHLAAVTKGSTATFYIDGQQVGTAGIGIYNSLNVIGNGGTNQPAGVIDEVRISSKAFTAQEVATAAAATEEYLPTTTTLALWHLNETNFGLVDSSTNKNTGVEIGNVQGVAGKFGNGRSVSASSQYILVDPVTMAGDTSIGMWVKFPLPATGEGWRTFAARSGGGYHHIIIHSGGNIGMYNNGWVDTGYNTNALSAGWHHVGVVSAGSTTMFYIDGVKVGNTLNGHITEPISTLGNTNAGGVAQNVGTFDEVQIWNRALSSEEMLAAGTATTQSEIDQDTVALWHFDETTSKVQDLSNNNYDLTVSGTTTQAGKIGQVRHMSGVRDYLQMPSFTADFTQGMTIAFWAKPSANNDNERFVDFGNAQSSDNIVLTRYGTTNNFYLTTFQGNSSTTSLTGTNAIINNEWHHYAVTIDTSNNARLYRDGVLFTSGTVMLPTSVLRTNNYIGKSSWNVPLFAGDIDEFVMSNTVKTGEEIQAMMAGLTVAELASYQQDLTGQGVIFDLVGNFTLSSGASIKGIGTGFPSDNGQGRGNRGVGYSGGGGGGNGGNGGIGQSDGSNTPAAGGTKYGDQLLPITLGSGGGSSAVGAAGGAGGGAFAVLARGKLINDVYVDGNITVSGTINMNGAIGKTGSPGGGGGAGGSILLHGNTCNISGNLLAQGGEGGNSDIDGGSGGGGRVSILYNIGPCSVGGTINVSQGVPTDAANYGAQVGQIGTNPPEPNTVPWPSQYQEQFELHNDGTGAQMDGKTIYAQHTKGTADVLGITETAIPVGGVINGTTVTLKADAFETGASTLIPKRLRIQVELKKINQTFDGTTGIYNSSTINFTNGTPVVLAVTIANLETGASYKWRVRTTNIDSGLTSGWQDYGGNAPNDADFTITSVESLDLTLGTSSMEIPDSTSITVTARNAQGQVDASYRGTVTFSSSSSTAQLPEEYTFTAGDNGSHTFSNALKFFESGNFSVTVEDTVNPVLVDSKNITITVPPVPFITLSTSEDVIIVGQQVTLTWQSGYLTDVSIDHGIGPVDPMGTRLVTPELGVTTYTIQGRRTNGEYLTASVTITASEGIVTTETPTPTPTSTPTSTPTGSVIVTNTPTVTSTPTVTGSTNPTQTTTPSITRRPRPTPIVSSCPVIEVFSVSNRLVKRGDAVQITWQVRDADKVSIDAFSGSLPKSGSASVVLSGSLEVTIFASKGTCKRTETRRIDVVSTYPWEGAGGMLIGLLALETISLQIGVAQGNIWFALLGLIDRSKKRKPWGVVYNAVTKTLLPRAVVRLWDAETGKLVDTVVTDANGIFKLTPRKGKYVIKVAHPEFTFPSKLVSSDTDTGFTNVYLGEVIEVHEETQLLMISVPLDPVKKQKKWLGLSKTVSFLEEVVGVVSPIILIAGFIYSIVVTMMYPLTINYIILGLYALTFLIKAYVYLTRPRLFGTVTGVDGKVVSGLEVGLFDSEFKNMISRTFTNKQGAYNFVVKNQNYYLQVLDPGYKLLGRAITKDGLLIKKSSGNSGVKLVAESLIVYPVQKLGKK